MEGKKISIGIVAAEFNYDVTYAMVELAKEHAKFLNAEIVEVMKVPGTYDIPFGVKILLSKKNIDCIVTLGAVIEGQTEHDDIITQQASRKIMDLSLEFNKPVALGISGPGMSRLEAHERVDYAKRAVEAVVKMCKIKFAGEESEEAKTKEKIEESGKEADKEKAEGGMTAEEKAEGWMTAEEFMDKLRKGKGKKRVGRPKKAREVEKSEKGKRKEKAPAGVKEKVKQTNEVIKEKIPKTEIPKEDVKEEKAKGKIIKGINNKRKEKIIEELKQKGKITTAEVMKMFKVTRKAVSIPIKQLLKERQITKIGEHPKTYYVLAGVKEEIKQTNEIVKEEIPKEEGKARILKKPKETKVEIKTKEGTKQTGDIPKTEIPKTEIPKTEIPKEEGKGKTGMPKKQKEIKTGTESEAKKEKEIKKIKKEEKEKIIEELKQKGKITTGYVMKMFNVAKSTAWIAMNELLKEGWIVRKGKKNETYYILA